MIVDPITLPPDATLADAESVMSRYRISGVPITDENGRLVGILTNRDVRFAQDDRRPISDFMTSEGLITARLGTTLAEAQDILHRYRIEKLPLVDDKGFLKGLITIRTSSNGRTSLAPPRMSAAGCWLPPVGVGEAGSERAGLLVEAGVDALAIDTVRGHSRGVRKLYVTCALAMRICRYWLAMW